MQCDAITQIQLDETYSITATHSQPKVPKKQYTNKEENIHIKQMDSELAKILIFRYSK